MCTIVKELSLEEIELGRAKALANARALIQDAEILFKAGRYPRSLALSHLACEELGKVIMLASIGLQSRLGQTNWNKFWRRFRSHNEKNKNILGMDYLWSPIRSDNSDIDEYLKDITKRFSEFEDLKLTALYTDYRQGTFYSPDEVIKHDIAHAVLELAKSRLRAVESIERYTIGKLKDIDIERVKVIRKMLKSRFTSPNSG